MSGAPPSPSSSSSSAPAPSSSSAGAPPSPSSSSSSAPAPSSSSAGAPPSPSSSSSSAPPGFSKEQIKHLHLGFNKLTKNGSLDKQGFATALKTCLPPSKLSASPSGSMELPHPSPRKQRLEELFNAFDSNKSGTVDFQEFASGLSLLMNGTESEKVAFAFQMLDVNGDGNITFEEMCNYFRTFLQSRQTLNRRSVSPQQWELITSHLKKGFEAADLDKSGTISLAEFERAIKDPDHPLSLVLDSLRFH